MFISFNNKRTFSLRSATEYNSLRNERGQIQKKTYREMLEENKILSKEFMYFINIIVNFLQALNFFVNKLNSRQSINQGDCREIEKLLKIYEDSAVRI